MMNQRSATVEALLVHVPDYELNGPTPLSDVLTDSMKAEVRHTLFAMFRGGEVSYSADFQSKVDDDAELKKYISGLVNNWVRKAPEFNSGGKYVVKNPGSRQGSGDGQIKNMKLLLAVTTDPTHKKAIEEEIASRQAEISKTKMVEVDYSKIPAHLREALGI